MKIAVVTNRAPALSVFRLQFLHEMVLRGHDVFALAPDHDAESRRALRQVGVEAVDIFMDRAGTHPIRELRTIFDIRQKLLKIEPDLCFSFFVKPVIYGVLAAWLAGVKQRYGLIEGLGFAFTPTTSFSVRRFFLQKVIGMLARMSLNRAAGLFFLNPDDLSEFVARGYVSPGITRILGGAGVDLSQWNPLPFQNGTVCFILVARLLKDKGIEDYVSAIRLVRKSFPESRFLLLGGLDDNPSGIKREEVESWVSEGIVEWHGHVPVKPWLEQAHVFVLPSYREGVPISTQEAMASGRPVITTDVPGCRETVKNDVNGFLVPARDPTALAEAMCRFLKDRSLIESMGSQSRVLAEERFDIYKQNIKLLELMQVR